MKITIIYPRGVMLTETRSGKAVPNQILSWDTIGSEGVLQKDDEGIRWLRGHYLPDAPEVDACRVALALGKQEPVKLTAQNPHIPLITRAIVDIAARVLTNLILEKKS